MCSPKLGLGCGVREVTLLLDAREEFLYAAEHYESEEPGLGEAFIAEVEQALERVASFPAHGNPYLVGTRRIVLKRFPYSVVYHEEAGVIVVVAVAHHRRRPGYWRARQSGP